MSGQNLRLDSFLPYRINVLAGHLSRRLAQVYGERFGISIAEWRVIAHLANQDRISVREIFERVDMDKSKISRAASNLEANGLIEKRTSTADRRLVEMRLTRKGRRLFAQIEPLALDFQDSLLAEFSERERASLLSLVDKLLNRLEHATEHGPGR